MKFLKKIQYNSPVVLSFALLSFAALVLNYVTAGWSNHALFSVYRSSPLSPLFWVRLFAHVLGHADLSHYTNNMLLFLLLGPMLEEKYGSKNLVFMISFVAVITGLINIIFSSYGLLGASGIVFMAIILSSVTSASEGRIPLTLIIIVIVYIGQEVFSGIVSKDNVSQITHIIGGVCGGGFGLLLSSKSSRRR